MDTLSTVPNHAPFIKILSNNVVKRLTVLMPMTRLGCGQFYFEGNDRATLSTIANKLLAKVPALIPQPLPPILGEGEPDFKVPLPILGEEFRVRAGTLSPIANGFGQSRAVERVHLRICQALTTPTTGIGCQSVALSHECWSSYRGDARK